MLDIKMCWFCPAGEIIWIWILALVEYPATSPNCLNLRWVVSSSSRWKTLTGWWLRLSSYLKFLSFKVSLWCLRLWDQIAFLCYWKSPLQTQRTGHSKAFTEATDLTEKHDFILAWLGFKSGQWFRCEWADCSRAPDQISLSFIFRNSLDQLWQPQRDVLWLRSANYKNSDIHC